MRRLLYLLSVILISGSLYAGEGKLMHCFYFTVVDGATSADWQAFHEATDALPGKIPGLLNVWYGKLRRPMRLVTTDRATMKKLRAGESKVTGEVRTISRQYGVCMEMADEAALKVYADHPAHKQWETVYSKVRVPGTTTVDIVK